MSTTNKEEKVADVSTENIYRLNGRVPLKKAIPFGLQHVLAMFVSNLAPVLIVCRACKRNRGTPDFCRDYTAFTMCYVRGRYRNMYAVISGMEDRVGASDSYGSQLYVSGKPVSNLYQSGTWI